jgi:hypothetical protein
MDRYERVGDIMVAMKGIYSIGGQIIAEDVTQSVVLNPEILPSVFAAPHVESGSTEAIKARDTGAKQVLWMPSEGEDQSKLLRRLKDLAQELSLPLAGLAFEEYENDELLGVGIAIRPPEKAVERAPEDKWMIRQEPPCELLTMIVRTGDSEVLTGAFSQLGAEITDRGLKRAGPYRIVKWKDDLAQLQAPVKP